MGEIEEGGRKAGMFKVLVPEEEGGPKLYYVKPWQSLGPGRDPGLCILWVPVFDFLLPAPAPKHR